MQPQKLSGKGLIIGTSEMTIESYSEFKSKCIMFLEAKYGSLALNNTFIKKKRTFTMNMDVSRFTFASGGTISFKYVT